MATKNHWDKTDGRICYHGYQSFAKGETTAETAHAIGVELAKRLWGERFEVLVATHCNTGCYHNHFVINSVSFLDGYKFYNSPADYQRMREESDRLCIEYGLSVIHVALKYYRSYHSGSGKTLKSIQISLISRLEKFNLDSLASITQTDEMELWSLGEKKSAIFAVIPDNDSSFNFLVGLLYTQLFQQLYYQADIVHGGRLPIHAQSGGF